MDGPKACIEASAQVELYDDLLGEDLPAGSVLHTAPVWEGTASTLRGQLDESRRPCRNALTGQQFPLFLGGEHGILPPLMHAARGHPLVDGDLSKVTVVQLDAHADLRSSLDDEVFSCMRRCTQPRCRRRSSVPSGDSSLQPRGGGTDQKRRENFSRSSPVTPNIRIPAQVLGRVGSMPCVV